MNNEKQSILVVEDDPNLGFVITDNLIQEGYEVTLVEEGNKVQKIIDENNFDLIILDVMLPGKDGFAIAREIRQTNEHLPIIYVTAKSLPEDKIRGFRTGADDYLTKPFNMEELLMRLAAILKRTTNKTQKDQFIIGEFIFNYKNLELKHPFNMRSLTKKEAELLRLLVIHKNEVLERETALNVVWGNEDYFSGRSMDVFITRLRKYLKPDETIQILNVHGVGFKLVVSGAPPSSTCSATGPA